LQVYKSYVKFYSFTSSQTLLSTTGCRLNSTDSSLLITWYIALG